MSGPKEGKQRAQVRKKVDPRIRTLIENGVKQHFRSFFVIVGDKGRDQVVNLHYMLSKTVVKTRPSVLWCYKKDLGFTTYISCINFSVFNGSLGLQASQKTDARDKEKSTAGTV